MIRRSPQHRRATPLRRRPAACAFALLVLSLSQVPYVKLGDSSQRRHAPLRCCCLLLGAHARQCGHCTLQGSSQGEAGASRLGALAILAASPSAPLPTAGPWRGAPDPPPTPSFVRAPDVPPPRVRG